MVQYIMIHHTGVSYDKNKDQFKANNNTHKGWWNVKSSLGFYLGYNYEIAKNGRVRQARKEGERTVACPEAGMNDGRCIHIGIDGNFNIEKPMPAQVFALRDLIKGFVKEFGIKKDNIVFHKQYANKSCPGDNMDISFVKSLAFPEVMQEEEVPAIDTKTEIKKTLSILTKLINKL